jgi:hypothetical protein
MPSVPLIAIQKTRQVTRTLGVPDYRLQFLIRSGKIPSPIKDCSGDFVWTAEDIERARAALRVDRRRKSTAEDDCPVQVKVHSDPGSNRALIAPDPRAFEPLQGAVAHGGEA